MAHGISNFQSILSFICAYRWNGTFVDVWGLDIRIKLLCINMADPSLSEPVPVTEPLWPSSYAGPLHRAGRAWVTTQLQGCWFGTCLLQTMRSCHRARRPSAAAAATWGTATQMGDTGLQSKLHKYTNAKWSDSLLHFEASCWLFTFCWWALLALSASIHFSLEQLVQVISGLAALRGIPAFGPIKAAVELCNSVTGAYRV